MGLLDIIKKSDLDDIYKLEKSNWFRALPYAFKVETNDTMQIFYLPISPQNITVTTHFATNIIATLTSTVEEHGEQRYFDISIQGTTGFSPKNIDAKDFISKTIEDNNFGKRESYAVSFDITKYTGGFFSKTANQAQQLQLAAQDLVGRNHEVGVYNDNNGYAAFHNFYRFLLKYKKSLLSQKEQNKVSPLIFMNYKDNIQYSCIIQRFALERSADNPLLYTYSIQLKAYDLKTVDVKASVKPLINPVEDMQSIAAKIKNKARKLKNLANGALSTLSTLGR